MEYDFFIRAQKDKEKDTKTLKKLELQLKAAHDSMTNTKLQHEKILSLVKLEIIYKIIFCLIFLLSYNIKYPPLVLNKHC